MMDLEAMRGAWQAQDAPLGEHLKLNNRLLQELLLSEHRRELRRKGWLARLELLSWAPAVALLGWFCSAHIGEWRFLLPGLLLFVWALVMPLVSMRQRAALQAVDFSQPVLVLQQEIERLKMQRMRTLKCALLIGQFVWWVPVMIVFFKGVFGVDLYAQPGWIEGFLLPCLAASLLVIPLAVLLSHWLGPRLAKSSRLRRLTDTLAGRDMQAAQEFLERLRRFEAS